MDWCDTSSIDWNAVDALGTWAVGIATGALAWRANSLARRLRSAEEERQANAAYATARSLHLELSLYANRLRRICDGLEALIERAPPTMASDAAKWLETAATFRLPESLPASLIGSLPKELGGRIGELFVRERTANATFANNATVVRQPVARPQDAIGELRVLLTRSVEELRTFATHVEETKDRLEAFLA